MTGPWRGRRARVLEPVQASVRACRLRRVPTRVPRRRRGRRPARLLRARRPEATRNRTVRWHAVFAAFLKVLTWPNSERKANDSGGGIFWFQTPIVVVIHSYS